MFWGVESWGSCDEDLAFLIVVSCVMDHFKSGYPGCRWGFPAERPIPNYSSPSAFYCFLREEVVVAVVAAAVVVAVVGGGGLVVAVEQRPTGRP